MGGVYLRALVPLRQLWELLGEYLAAHRAKVALLAVLMLVAAGLQLLEPLVMAHFIDSAVQGAPAQTLTLTAMTFLALATLSQAIGVAETYVTEDVGWSTTNALRANVALHCLRLDMPFHLKYPPGQLIERIDGDVATLSGFFSRLILSAISSVLLLVGSLAVLASIDARVAAAFAVLAVLGALLIRAMRHVGVPFNEADREAQTQLNAYIQERLSGTEDIRARGATPYVLRGLWQLMHMRMHVRSKAAAVGMAQWGVMIMLFAAGTSLAFSLGGALFQSGAITIGTVFLILNYSWRITAPLSRLTQHLEELQRASASIRRLRELLGQSTSLETRDRTLPPSSALRIELENVSFGYTLDEPVLRDVSFRVEPGEVLGVLGRTGSGKTTITRLLLRLYDPNVGSVRLGGVDIRGVSPAAVRERVGMVTQEVQLFAASVRDNLTFFNREISDRRVVAALEALELGAWYRSLPLGLDTPLSSGGTGLSAGEGQLLAFARVFLREPGLVILDEASSRLDPATERRIERAVDVLLKGRTGVVVAHRLATVQRADRVLVLEDGSVAEHGPRADLAAQTDSRYAGLLRTGLEVAFA